LKIRWVSLALDDLREIDEFITKDNPVAAQKVLAVIWDTTQLLKQHPHLGRPGRVSGTRELVISGTPFIIPYRVVSDEIQVLRVIHGARNWPDKFD
jgi:addiction module RelE/StbE family toxin